MKKSTTLVKTLLVIGLGALLSYFGFSLPERHVEQVVDEVVNVLSEDPAPQVTNDMSYHVLSVTDGDTFHVRIDGTDETIRVLGINTPETKYSRRGAECFGAEASVYAKTLLEGTSIQLKTDDSQDTRDKYGRLLAYATLPEGDDFGEKMIANGYAYEYTFKGREYKNQELYKEVQKQAKESGVGLWRDGVCIE